MNPALPQVVDSLDLARFVPAASIGAATLALACGLLLWLFGGRLLRPLFAALGAAVGGALGSLAAPALSTDLLPALSAPQEGLFLGGLGGLVAALVLHRLTVAFAAGLLAATVAATAALSFAAPQPASELSHDAFASAVRSVALPPPLTHFAPAPLEPMHAAASRAGVEFLSREWDALGVRRQAVLLVAAIFGGLGGVLFGLAGPRKASALLTALLGAAVTIASVGFLAGLLPPESISRVDAQRVLAAWAVMGVAGFVFQTFRIRAPEPRPAGAP